MRDRGVAVAIAGLTLLFAVPVLLAQAPKQKPGLEPAPVQSSALTVKLEPAGAIPVHTNPTSPIAAGSTLLLIEQSGYLYRWDGAQAVELLTPKTFPIGVKAAGVEHIVNVAATADGATVYVMFMSFSAPNGVPRRTSPREPDAWLVLYAYGFDGTRLQTPKPITAMQVRTDGHLGGGLVVLPDGAVLFAMGDNGDSFEDGREHPQNAAVHLGKIVRIDPHDGSTKIVASGVRCVQRLSIATFDSESWLVFSDPGGWISEEVDAVKLTDLLAATSPIDFGWGRGSDSKTREGTFYIDREGNSTAVIPAEEPGFVDPIAEFGRESAAIVAVSGPVASASSFSRIALLYGDLTNGAVYAIDRPPSLKRQATLRVNLVNESSQPTTLSTLAGGGRPDPRFFNFPDGSAGVLLEKTGAFYRVTEVR